VINRLEEFAAAVHDRLGTIDFVTKREIIRGLVKRVEIHKDEILVVFRVDPDPGFNASETSTGSGIGEKSMQERTRRKWTALRRPSFTGHHYPIDQRPAVQIGPDQTQHASVGHLPAQSSDQQVMINAIEELLQIDVHHNVPPRVNVLLRRQYRLVSAATGTKTIAMITESRVQQRLQNL